MAQTRDLCTHPTLLLLKIQKTPFQSYISPSTIGVLRKIEHFNHETPFSLSETPTPKIEHHAAKFSTQLRETTLKI